MMADICYPIFTLKITVLAFSVLYIKKELFGGFAPTPSPRHRPRPPGELTAPPDPPPPAMVFGFAKNQCAIFFLYYPLVSEEFWWFLKFEFMPFGGHLEQLFHLMTVALLSQILHK